MNKVLTKIIKDAVSTNNCIVGSKEVVKNIDKAKLIICSNTIDKKVKSKVDELCKIKNIPIYNLDKTSKELGRLCNKPYRVSILSILKVEDKDLELLLKEAVN